jgi:hypothetical protein
MSSTEALLDSPRLGINPGTRTNPNIEESTGQYDYFGKALAVGDFDRNGIDDLAIGVPGEDIGSAGGAGAVNIIFGTTSGLSATGDVLIREGNGSRATAGCGVSLGTGNNLDTRWPLEISQTKPHRSE